MSDIDLAHPRTRRMAIALYAHVYPWFVVTSLFPGRIVARAEMTRRMAHGERYLETMIFLADGRVLRQVNPGIPDLENDWHEMRRFTDLTQELRDLRRDGWQIQAKRRR